MCVWNLYALFRTLTSLCTCVDGVNVCMDFVCPIQGIDELMYMPMWVACWTFTEGGEERRRNYHVEPYVLGKFIKFNSNYGYVNLEARHHASECHQVGHIAEHD